MKKKSMLALALAAFVFAGCSDDVKDPDQGGENGEAWVSLSIAPSTLTKALNGPDPGSGNNPHENGTANETKVNSLRAVLFDANKMVVGSATMEFDDTDSGWTGKDVDLDATRTTKAFKVPKTSKYILVILNPPSSALPTASVGMTYDQYNAAITATVTDLIEGSTTGVYDNFMMTNARGDLEPGTTTLTVHKSADDAVKAPTALYVDRVVSKVRVYATGVTSANFTLEGDFNWKLNVTNKKFFPVSKRTETAIGTATWSDRYSLGSYRIDPNYDHTAIVYTPGATGNENDAYKANYYYFTEEPSSWNEITTATNIGNEQDDKTNVKSPVEYCLENTQNADGNYHAYTTHVILKTVLTPKTFQDVDQNTITTADQVSGYGTNWFKIGAGLYTTQTLEGYILKELINKASDATYVTHITNAINIYLAGDGESSTSKVEYDLTVEGTTPTSVTAAFMTQLANVVTAAKSHMVGEVSYYHGGVNYYKIMIKHDNVDTDEHINELGEFGVVRNSVYDVHVSKVNNPGYPVIPEPDPKTPDEEGDYYLAVKININPWTWYTQTVEL